MGIISIRDCFLFLGKYRTERGKNKWQKENVQHHMIENSKKEGDKEWELNISRG